MNFSTDNLGFIFDPELTDSLIKAIRATPDSVEIHIEVQRKDVITRYAIECTGVLAYRIENLTEQNISMDFFVSSIRDSTPPRIDKDFLDFLFCRDQPLSIERRDAERMLDTGVATLFGNEASCGCVFAVLCRTVTVNKVERA